MNQKITKKSVALAPIDRKIVDKLAREKGFSFSAALRVIIREWTEQKQAKNTQP